MLKNQRKDTYYQRKRLAGFPSRSGGNLQKGGNCKLRLRDWYKPQPSPRAGRERRFLPRLRGRLGGGQHSVRLPANGRMLKIHCIRTDYHR